MPQLAARLPRDPGPRAQGLKYRGAPRTETEITLQRVLFQKSQDSRTSSERIRAPLEFP